MPLNKEPKKKAESAMKKAANPAGARFVEALGLKEAESYVWFSKKIED
jgi:hypothetical protein